MLSRPQAHGATGGFKSTKSTHAPIGNQTRDLPDHSAVPQPTAPPPTASKIEYKKYFTFLGITTIKNLQMKTVRKCDTVFCSPRRQFQFRIWPATCWKHFWPGVEETRLNFFLGVPKRSGPMKRK
jgi:hypothetical protein